MGQQRTDSGEQRAAKQRVADSRRCPACERRSALSSPNRFWDDVAGHLGTVRECLYCNHAVGILCGKTFGRDGSDYPTQAACEAALTEEGVLE